MPEKFRGRVKRLSGFHAAFDPDFVKTLFLPVGKQAHTVGAGFDRVKMLLHLAQREIFIHVLPHHVGGLNIERNFCDYTQRAQSNHRSAKCFTVVLAGQLDQFTICSQDFQRRRGRRQVPVLDSGAMCRSGTGAGDRNVGQGGEVMQGKALAVEIRAQLPVAHAGFDGHGAGVRVQRNHFVHRPQGKQIVGAVGNVVEAVTGPENFQVALFFDKFPRLLQRVGGEKVLGAVHKIACPIRQLLRRCPGKQRRDDGAGKQRRKKLDKGSLVHG